ncbi:hypothetical protein OIG_03007 [Enterococcus faecium EnGen0028]|nr:hypothetical protein OIG_03007 [Enterococcus faecium EnGen0028]
MNIALVGNPNSGKTSLFNLLTGSNQYVGNWPGVTVEKKEGSLKKKSEHSHSRPTRYLFFVSLYTRRSDCKRLFGS